MAKNRTNPKADFFFAKAKQWQDEYQRLRTIILDCGLDEVLKWGCPCYVVDGRNVVLIHGFKDYCALLFFKGALLKDSEGILVQQTPAVQSSRQIRFTNVREVVKLKSTLKDYVREAIEVEKAGLKVKLKKTSEFEMPEEFRKKLEEKRDLKTAFNALTPGRQRGYLLYFSSAKQSRTRESRIERYMQHILNGKGLND